MQESGGGMTLYLPKALQWWPYTKGSWRAYCGPLGYVYVHCSPRNGWVAEANNGYSSSLYQTADEAKAHVEEWFNEKMLEGLQPATLDEVTEAMAVLV
jgi:hypothetical protein